MPKHGESKTRTYIAWSKLKTYTFHDNPWRDYETFKRDIGGVVPPGMVVRKLDPKREWGADNWRFVEGTRTSLRNEKMIADWLEQHPEAKK